MYKRQGFEENPGKGKAVEPDRQGIYKEGAENACFRRGNGMIHGFIKTAAVTPKVQVAEPEGNAREIIRLAKEAAGNGAKIIVFPELCITGYTCGDLFLQELLLELSLIHISWC